MDSLSCLCNALKLLIETRTGGRKGRGKDGFVPIGPNKICIQVIIII